MAHEVVNGANGSVTWCSGLGCPRCDADRELNERLRRGEMVTMPIYASAVSQGPAPSLSGWREASFAGGTWHWPERV